MAQRAFLVSLSRAGRGLCELGELASGCCGVKCFRCLSVKLLTSAAQSRMGSQGLRDVSSGRDVMTLVCDV